MINIINLENKVVFLNPDAIGAVWKVGKNESAFSKYLEREYTVIDMRSGRQFQTAISIQEIINRIEYAAGKDLT